jgi:hypothetical protein
VPSDQVLNLLLAIIGTLIAGIGAWFVSEFKQMRLSVEELNISVAKVISKLEVHEERLDNLEAKVRRKPK